MRGRIDAATGRKKVQVEEKTQNMRVFVEKNPHIL
jgi:hypothetical protein